MPHLLLAVPSYGFVVSSLFLLVSIDTMLRKRLRATKHRAQLVRGARASLTSRSATQAGVIWQTGQ